MELRHLQVFSVLAETLHFGRAAEKLHVSQPALSRTIRDLEADLGVALFTRTTHHVALTDAGADFVVFASRILTQARYAGESARRVARGEKGILRIGYTDGLNPGMLSEVLKSFRSQNRGATFLLQEANPRELREMLRTGCLDCVFPGQPLKEDSAEFGQAPLASRAAVLCVAAEHPLAARTSCRIDQLKSLDFVVLTRETAPAYRAWLSELFHSTGWEMRISVEADRVATLLLSVESGLGAVVLPESSSYAHRSRLRSVRLVGSRSHTFQPMALWRRAEARPLVRSFVEHVSRITETTRSRRSRQQGPSPGRPAKGLQVVATSAAEWTASAD